MSGRVIVKQALAYDNHDKRMHIAKAIVNGIAENIYFTLYHYYRHGKTELKDYLDWLRKDVKSMLLKIKGINQLLALEGEIWGKFYATFKFILPEDFAMLKRVKRPPDNPINALISFGNTLLYTKTVSQLYETHLNQSISFLHEPVERRFSLSLDLSEVFKPIIVFKTIFDCVNNRKITVEKHFDKKLNYALLNESGKKIFVEEYENRINNVFEHTKLRRKVTYKTAIKIDGYKLIKYIIEGKDFVPFSLENKQ
ncbi:MAG: CRISPR-associated endonuclease Cas1 [Clostridiales bacterium]|nr:CRISPR-associated endonuclease Cas1 [Clostridiales bacterium]